MVGDFNCIDSSREKMEGRAFVNGVEARKFWVFIKGNGLMNMEIIVSQFT